MHLTCLFPVGALSLGLRSQTVHSLESSVLNDGVSVQEDAVRNTQDLANVTGVTAQYRKKLENILSSTSLSNQKIIYIFLERELPKRGLSEGRRLKYTRIISLLLKTTKKSLTRIKQNDIETFFFWLKNNTKLSDDTKKDYWNMFRILVEWLNPKLEVRNYRLKVKLKTKLPEDILSEEEISKLISACQGVRDKALISLTYHGALRSGSPLS